jgi:FMN reductase
MNKKILLISSSLRDKSSSLVLIEEVADFCKSKNLETEIINLAKIEIPFCDGRETRNYPENIQNIYNKIIAADYIVFGFPVYCYSISGVLKNFIDIFSQAFAGKYFGICLSVGSKLSYLAAEDLIKILGFESKAVGVHPVIMVDKNDFSQGKISNQKINDKIIEMIKSLVAR